MDAGAEVASGAARAASAGLSFLPALLIMPMTMRTAAVMITLLRLYQFFLAGAGVTSIAFRVSFELP